VQVVARSTRPYFGRALPDVTRYETIGYPGLAALYCAWFLGQCAYLYLAAQLQRGARKKGRIFIVGISIGGHFGYAAALPPAGKRVAT